MAVTIAELSKAIRATTDDPTGTILADVTRLHGAGMALIDRYAMSAPDGIKDLALIQLAQYLYDAPVAQRRFTTSALRESGASALLSPYRAHRAAAGDVVGAVAEAAGVDRNAVIAIIQELVSNWALQADDDPLPAGKLANAPSGGLDQGAVDNRIGALVRTFAQTGSEDMLEASQVSIDTEGFDGNLGSGDDNVQAVAQKVDDLQLAAGGTGLSQAQVDARILAAVPIARRWPHDVNMPASFTSADNGVFPAWNETDNAFVNGSLLNKNGFTWTYNATTNYWELDSDKLDQSEVDARIDNAIPAARRIPGFAVGDANEYLQVNGDGTALIFAPGPTGGGMVTQAAVYAQLKEIAQAGHRVTLSFDDTANELTIAVDDVPAGNSFPANPSVGDRFRLLMADTIHNDALLDIVEGDQPPLSMVAVVNFGSGLPSLQSYAPNYSGSGASTLAGKTFILFGGAPSDLATNVIAYAPGASRLKYPVNQNPVGGSYPHFYEVPTLGIATLRLLSAQAGVDSQEDAAFNLDFASGAQAFPDSEFATGDYTYAGGAVHWELTPGVAAPWATQGQPEPRTLLAITQLIDGAGVGLTVNNASANTFGPNTGFMPAFDLDDADKQQGIFEIEATLRFTARSANTISFEDGGAIIETRITGFIFASALRATDEFVVNTLTGVKVAEATVYDGSTVLGTLALRMVRDGDNVAGYAFQFESGLGSGSQNFAVSATLDIAFLHNDAPPAATAGGLTFTLIQEFVSNSNIGLPYDFSGQGLTDFQAAWSDTSVHGFLVTVTASTWERQSMLWKGPVALASGQELTGSMANVSGGNPVSGMAVLKRSSSTSRLEFKRASNGWYWDANRPIKVYKVE